MNLALQFSTKGLKLFTISYLALPVLLFFIFWIKPIYSIILIVVFLYSFYQYSKNSKKSYLAIPLWQLISVVIIVGIWVFISGAGGWGFQSPDLAKHSSIYKDIIENGSPTSYIYHSKKIYLSAYLGYYISIPLIFGSLPWPIMMSIITIFTFLGAILGVFWFCILAKSFSPKWVLFFMLVGGLDFAGLINGEGITKAFSIIREDFYNKLPFFAISIDPKMLLLYEGNTHSLFWGPQHALVCWLATGLFTYEWFVEKSIKYSPVYLILVPFWSPFILLGLTPIIIYQTIKDGIKKYLILSNLAMIPIFIVIIWFVNSVPVANLEKGFIFYKPDRLLNYLYEIKAYLFFVFFEVIIWLIPTYLILKKNKESKSLLFFIAIILCLVPMYKLGKWNDFVQRVSMPALFILWILVAQAWQVNKKLIFNALFSVLLIVGSWDSVYHILFSLKVTNYKIKYTAQPYEKVTNFVETSEREKWPIEQSFAPDSASFFRYLGK